MSAEASARKHMLSIPIDEFGDALFSFSQRHTPDTVEELETSLESLCLRAAFDPVANELLRRLKFNWKPDGQSLIPSNVVYKFLTKGVSDYLSAADWIEENQPGIDCSTAPVLLELADSWRKELGHDGYVSKSDYPKVKFQLEKHIESKIGDILIDGGKAYIAFALVSMAFGLSSVAAAGLLGPAAIVPLLFKASTAMEFVDKAHEGISLLLESRKAYAENVWMPEILNEWQDNPQSFPLLPEFAEKSRSPRSSQIDLARQSFYRVMQVCQSLPKPVQLLLKGESVDALLYVADAVLQHIGNPDTIGLIDERIKRNAKISSIAMNALVDHQPTLIKKAKRSLMEAAVLSPEIARLVTDSVVSTLPGVEVIAVILKTLDKKNQSPTPRPHEIGTNDGMRMLDSTQLAGLAFDTSMSAMAKRRSQASIKISEVTAAEEPSKMRM
jgi:hypothetical protein